MKNYFNTQDSPYVQGELFRFDKNFANNMDNVSILADDGGGGLLRSVLYYLADSYQHNTLNVGLFDVDDFAKKYGFSVEWLRKKHPAPFHLQNLSNDAVLAYRNEKKSSRWDVSDSRVWDSNIENALYILNTKLATSSVGKVLNSLSAVYRGKRLLYRYELSENFIQNLSNFYVTVNRQCLIATRKTNLDILYLAVQELKTAVGLAGETRTAPGTVSFDRLRALAKVSTETKAGKSVPMREQKRLINNAFKTIDAVTDIKCRLLWEHLPGANYASSPVIMFYDDKEMTAMHPESQVRKMLEKTAVSEVLKENLIHEFYQAFREVERLNKVGPAGADAKQRFACWFFSSPSSDVDRVARRMAYISACFHAFNRYPEGLDAMFEDFTKRCLDFGMDGVSKFLDVYISET